MTRVYFSTVERGGVDGAGAYVLVDWENKEVRAQAGVVLSEVSRLDPNPRGGYRGGRGMWVTDDRVYAASNDRINIFDQDFRGDCRVSNSLLFGLHEVFLERPGRLWVTSTRFDAALEIDLATGEITRSYWPRQDPRLQESLGLTPPQEKTPDDLRLLTERRVLPQDPDLNHLHLNAVASYQGDLYALFNKLGVIVNLERGEVVARDEVLEHAHNLVIRDGEIFVTATKARKVCQFDLRSGRILRSLALRDLDWVRSLEASLFLKSRRGRFGRKTNQPIIRRGRGGRDVVAKPAFARGLQIVDDTVYVGISPASILSIDWTSGQLIDTYQYSENVFVAVHGLQVVTDN